MATRRHRPSAALASDHNKNTNFVILVRKRVVNAPESYPHDSSYERPNDRPARKRWKNLRQPFSIPRP